MRYRKLGNSTLNVSVICHGTWGLGNDFFGRFDEKLAIKAIHSALDTGVNIIDTAHAYGNNQESEKIVGKAITGRRDKVVLATKCGLHRLYGEYVRSLNPIIIRRELEESLKNLKTDYLDLYQIHWPDQNLGIEKGLRELVKMRDEGKIREIGVSNFSIEEMETGIKIAGIASVQPQLSILKRDNINNGVIPFCKNNGLGILSYGTLGGGILTGKKTRPANSKTEIRSSFYNFYEEPMWSKCQELNSVLENIGETHNASISEVAINWALAQPGVTSVLVGARSPEKVLENVKAGDWELSGEELDVIEKGYKRIMG